MLGELNDQEIEGVLLGAMIGRIGCHVDARTYIVPISYSFDRAGNCLYGFSTLGQKIVWMRANPKVCVAVDEVADQFNWNSVLVIGRYEELRDAHEAREPWQRVHELFEQRQTWWLPATGNLATGDERETPIFYRIRVDRLSGRRTTRPA